MNCKPQKMCIALWIACLVTPVHLNIQHNSLFTSQGHLTTPQMIVQNNYPEETHEVRTADGYILTIHRIPHRASDPARSKPVVLLQHGLLGSSADWVIAGAQKGLAFVLSDAGYDVWLGNARGNVYSKRHAWLSTRDRKFWNFSWHEMGVYDLPAIIDYILEVSKQHSLYYVGHSMGCTMFFVLTSTLPHYNSKFRIMFGFGPAVFNSHTRNKIFRISAFSKVGAEADRLYNCDFFPNNWMRGRFLHTFCRDGAPTQIFCSSILYLIGGLDSTQLNTTMLPVILTHFPAGSSLKSWVHYGQKIRSGLFQQYDHGFDLNLKYYGTPEPPVYNLTAVTVPVSLHACDADSLITYQDAAKLYRALPKTVGLFRVPLPTFAHFDFLWGLDAKNLVYDLVTNLMKKF